MPNNLAQKYRPKTFSEVVGQPDTVKNLEGMLLEETPPPAILLHGPTSSGKTTLSRIIPTYTNCQDTEYFEPCWECQSCKGAALMIAGTRSHPDVEVINCAGERGIEMTRSLRRRATFEPRFGYRWFILDECHRLTPDAQENLLTLLEEPSKKTRFILLTTNPEKLKKTLKDRCQVFPLKTVETVVLTKLVRKVTKAEGKPLPSKACKEIADVADGYPRVALKLTEQVLNSLKNEKGKLDPKKLSTAIQEVTQYAPSRVCSAYMDGLFSGNYTLCFSALDNVDNYEFVASHAIKTIQEALYHWIDPARDQLKGQNPYLLKGIEELPSSKEGVRLLKLGYIQKLLDIYLNSQGRIKSYMEDPKALMQSATMESIRLVTKWKASSKKKATPKKTRKKR